MTLGIFITEDGDGVYAGIDRRVGFNEALNQPIDHEEPKFLKIGKITIFFAGRRGLQDQFEVHAPLYNLFFENQSFDVVTQKLCNILYTYKYSEGMDEIVVSDGKRVTYITTNGDKIHDHECKNKNLFVIGVTQTTVVKLLESSKKTLPMEKIKEVLESIAKYNPKVVGGKLDLFKIE